MYKKLVKLDLKDKKLLHALDFHARTSYVQLAKQVGLSKQGVEYKMHALIKKGVIEGVYPILNISKLGYIYCRLAIVLQNVTPTIEKEIVEYLIKDKRIFWVFTTQGAFDFLAVMWVTAITEFKEIITDFLSKYGKYVKEKNESVMVDVVHYQHRYLLRKQETEEIHIKETKNTVLLDEREKNILRALCADARISAVEIAKKLNLSSQAVSYHIKKLEKQKIIEGYRPIINHHKLGYTYYKLWINIHYDHIDQIRKLYSYIKENPIVLYVVEGVGLPEDLDVEVMVQDNQELFTFIKDLKLKFPNLIGDYRSFMFIETKKVRYLPF